MTVAVWKYMTPLAELSDVVIHDMPKGANLLSAVNQNECLAVYAMVNPEVKTVPVPIHVVGTGHEHGHVPGDFLGTVLFEKGRLVFHIFGGG